MYKNIVFERIDTTTLLPLLKDIELINYWVKRKETMISKSNFYVLKKHLINYIILCCKNEIYNEDEVSYMLDGVEINRDEDGKEYRNRLIKMTLFINGQSFKFHRILDKTLKQIIGKNNIDKLDVNEYQKNEENFVEVSEDELFAKYKTITDILCEKYNWCILRYVDDYNWIKTIEKIYGLYKLIPSWNYYKCLRPKKSSIRIKLFATQKVVEQISVDYNNFRLNTDSVLKKVLPKNYYKVI